MNKARIMLIAARTSEDGNGELSIDSFMVDNVNIENDLSLGADVDSLRGRYNAVNRAIHTMVIKKFVIVDKSFFIGELSDKYLNVLETIFTNFPDKAKELRIGNSFHPANTLEQYINDFTQIVNHAKLSGVLDVKSYISFFKKALKEGYSVIEVIDSCYGDEVDVKVGFFTNVFGKLFGPKLFNSTYEEPAQKEFTENVGSDNQITNLDESINSREILVAKINSAVNQLSSNGNMAVSFSGAKNDDISEVLRAFVYAQGDPKNPTMIPIIYADGSQARPFPFYCLKNQNNNLQGTEVLRIGLLSGRHLELDSIINMYWFRNQEVSIGRTQGETDELCYQKSKKMFSEMKTGEKFKIFLYQTGLEPAVVGFYRALVEEILENRKKPYLEIIPMYFIGGKYSQGTIWS